MAKARNKYGQMLVLSLESLACFLLVSKMNQNICPTAIKDGVDTQFYAEEVNLEAKTEKKRSSVLRTRRLSGSVRAFLLETEDDTLREFAESSKSGRAAKTLIKQGAMRITLVALKKGTDLPSHHVTGPISIQDPARVSETRALSRAGHELAEPEQTRPVR